MEAYADQAGEGFGVWWSQEGTVVSDLCRELGMSSQTLNRTVNPTGEVHPAGQKILNGETKR